MVINPFCKILNALIVDFKIYFRIFILIKLNRAFLSLFRTNLFQAKFEYLLLNDN